MNYDEMVEKAMKAMQTNTVSDAQTYAMLAVADRLDRLCKIMSRGN